MQRTSHGERETSVRRKGAFTRYIDQVSREARSEQSAQEVYPQADPSEGGSTQVSSSLGNVGDLVSSTCLFML
jgi:hypothetical protein